MQTKNKLISYLLLTVLILSLIPLFWIGKYNHPSADDYSYGLAARLAFEESGNFFDAVGAAFENTIHTYQVWQGTYSSVFLMSLQPSIFHNRLYALTPILMIGSLMIATWFFLNTLFRKVLGAPKTEVQIFTLSLLIIMIQTLAYPVEGFYWYNSSIHYVFMNSLMLTHLAILIHLFYTDKIRNRTLLILCASFLGFVVSGANYVSALLQLELLLILVLIAWYQKKKFPVSFSISLGISLLGFILNVSAPGNRVRQASFEITPPLKAIVKSFKSAISYFDDWFGVLTILTLLILVPTIYKIVKQTTFKFPYPVLVSLISFCLFASMHTPGIYSLGIVGAGRTLNVIYLFFYFMVFLNAVYWVGFLTQLLSKERLNEFAVPAKKRILFYTIPLLVCICMTIYFTPANRFTSLSAGASIYFKEAQLYHVHMVQREALLESNEEIVTLPKLAVKPYLLYFDDITNDPTDWRNTSVAKYYHKKEVRLSE